MSAIGAVWALGSQSCARFLDKVLAAQSAYGTEAPISQSDDQVSLGVVPSCTAQDHSNQPLWSADRSICLCADIRLDNRTDLSRELHLVHAEELSDAEILLAAWLRWGRTCVDQLLGGFAFVVWVPSRRELFAARDHVGERPLYFHQGTGFFALSSMPKGLLAIPGVFRGFNEAKTVRWTACLPPDLTGSFFAGIERIPPGHMVRVTPDGIERTRYWHPSEARPVRYAKDEDYAEAFLEIFDRATEERLHTAGPIGSFLSSGLDSSAATTSAAILLGRQNKRLTAFTSVPRTEFIDPGLREWHANEGPEAAAIAACYPNIEHVLVDSAGYDLVANMRRWIDAMDEPALNVANYLYFTAIFDRARERGIDTLLQGAAGNGSFSWETTYILAKHFREGRWLRLVNTAYLLRKHGALSIRGAVRSAFAGPLPKWARNQLIPAAALRNLWTPLVRPEILRKYSIEENLYERVFSDRYDLTAEHAAPFDEIDFAPTHAGAQALGRVELRDATADKRVYDFCFGIPVEQYVVGGHSRSLARRALKSRLPSVTVNRYVRGCQSSDWEIAFEESAASLREEAEAIGQSTAASSVIDVAGLRNFLAMDKKSDLHTAMQDPGWHISVSLAVSLGYFLRSQEAAAAQASPAVI